MRIQTRVAKGDNSAAGHKGKLTNVWRATAPQLGAGGGLSPPPRAADSGKGTPPGQRGLGSATATAQTGVLNGILREHGGFRRLDAAGCGVGLRLRTCDDDGFPSEKPHPRRSPSASTCNPAPTGIAGIFLKAYYLGASLLYWRTAASAGDATNLQSVLFIKRMTSNYLFVSMHGRTRYA